MSWKGDDCWWCRLPAAELAALERDDPEQFERHMAGRCAPREPAGVWEARDCRSCQMPAAEMAALRGCDPKRFYWHIVGACAEAFTQHHRLPPRSPTGRGAG